LNRITAPTMASRDFGVPILHRMEATERGDTRLFLVYDLANRN